MAVLDTLRHLAQTDIDAIRAYTQAIDNCGDEALARLLSGFRDDHRRHVADLSTAIRDRGDAPPTDANASGFALAGFTAVTASAGATGALMVMESNEIVTNDAYDKALSEDLPAEMRDLVERNRADERRHLSAIRARLEARPGGRIMSGMAQMQGWSTAAWMNTLRRELPAALLVGAGAAWLLGGMLSRPRGERVERRPRPPGTVH